MCVISIQIDFRIIFKKINERNTPVGKSNVFQIVLDNFAELLDSLETWKNNRIDKELSTVVDPGILYRDVNSRQTNDKLLALSSNIATNFEYNRWTIPPNKSIFPLPQHVGKKQ